MKADVNMTDGEGEIRGGERHRLNCKHEREKDKEGEEEKFSAVSLGWKKMKERDD